MAAIAFDPLEYAHQLEASGIPREQAEVHAKAMTAMFLHNFDALVTRDYLDTRFSEFETRVEASIDRRFVEVDKRFTEMESKVDKRFAEVDSRFVEMESKMDKRFADVESSIERNFSEMKTDVDKRFAGIDVRLARINVLLGVVLAALAIPVLQTVLMWVG